MLPCLPNSFPGCCAPLPKASPRFSKVRRECQHHRTWWLYTAPNLGHLAGRSGCPQLHHDIRGTRQVRELRFLMLPSLLSPMTDNLRCLLLRFPSLVMRKTSGVHRNYPGEEGCVVLREPHNRSSSEYPPSIQKALMTFRLDLLMSLVLLLSVFYLPYYGLLKGKNKIIQLISKPWI